MAGEGSDQQKREVPKLDWTIERGDAVLMGIFDFVTSWAARHRPDSLSRGSPHRPGRRRRKLPAALLLALCATLSTSIVAQAATAQTAYGEITSNGTYTVIAVDEAGNKTFKNVTISNIVPRPPVDEDGNIYPDDVPNTDEVYTEDIVATLLDDTIINTNGVYTVMVVDEAGNITQQSVTVRNIVQPTTEPGKDEDGNLVPDTPGQDDGDYTEDIVDTLEGTQTVTSNGQFTAFVYDEAGNLTKRTYTVTNIKEYQTPGPDEPVIPDDVPDTDEDYTEDIVDSMSDSTNVTTNGVYSAAVYDEAGNLTMVDIEIMNIYEADDPDNPQPGPEDPIVPDDVPNTDEDYTEDIVSELSKNYTVTESGIYAAIVHDRTGNIGSISATVTINEDPNPDIPGVDPIEPDEPGTEFPSTDGSSMTDTTTVYENGFYSAGGVDNVGNIGLETIMVRNINAPDVKIIENPATLVRKTDSQGNTYGEATITFTVTIPDGALIDYVKVVNEDDEEMPLTLKNNIYTVTVTKNGEYRILSADVTGRDGEYPLLVDYIYELDTPELVEAMAGETVELNANVVGGYPESYQWYTCDAMGENAKPIQRETSDHYTFKATRELHDTYYFVTATKGDYTVVSKPIHLTVSYPPVLTNNQGYVIAAENSEFVMSVGTTSKDTIQITDEGNPNDYQYQWYYAAGRNATLYPIEGMTDSVLSLTAEASMNEYYYFCEVYTDKYSVMSEPVFLYVVGKPTTPTIKATLNDGTVIPSDTWSVNQPLTVTIGGSTVQGTSGTIEYKYSFDMKTWYNYEKPIVFDKSTEITYVYAKAVNVSMISVESQTAEHIVKIELEDPSLHPGEDDVVPGVRFDQTTWVNTPRPIHIYVDTLSGVGEIDVFFKGEGETEFHELLREDGTPQYQLDESLVDGEHFTATRLEMGLWRIDFGAAENGWYKVSFKDIANRPFDSAIGTQEFEVTRIDYGIPTIVDATLDKEGHANEKTITVTDAHDEYTASIYGYSELYGFAYSNESSEAPAKGDPAWQQFTSQNSSYTVDENGTRHYSFDIHLAGHDDNGTYHIWVIDNAGNVSEAKVVQVDGLMDKMENVQFDRDSLDLTVPVAGIVKVTFNGEPASISVETTNESVATGSYEMTSAELVTVTVNPVNYGTATITITLKDYDGTTYKHDVSVTVKNMIPTVKTDLQDVTTKPDTSATLSATFEGTNLSYTWYYATGLNGEGTPITSDNDNYSMSVVDSDATLHTPTLTIKNATADMDGTYYWVVAQASEGTPAYTTRSRTAKLTVLGNVSAPTITANSGAVVSGQWTNTDLSFVFSGSTIPAGAGQVGYQYRYDNEETWSDCASATLTYSGDTHEKTLHVRAYNTLDKTVVSDTVDFIIRVDTVLPEVVITGNPTEWVSVDQTLTATVTDADSGITDETVKMSVKNSEGVDNGTCTPAGDGKYTFVITHSDTYTVTVHDQAGNELVVELRVNRIDKAAPTLAITQGTPDGTLCPVTIYATDDASTSEEILYTFDGGETWTRASMQILTLNKTYVLGAKDAAGNITKKSVKITGNSSSGGGGGGGEPELITDSILAIDGYMLGKTKYISISPDGRTEEVHDYVTTTISGAERTVLPVQIEAFPAEGGYLAGYAQLSTGQRYPIYWDDAATSTVTSTGGTGTFYIEPETLTSSAKNGSVTVQVSEYENADASGKILNRDSVRSPITIDVDGPVVNISLDPVTKEITITARDAVTGIGKDAEGNDMVTYCLVDESDARSETYLYTGSFNLPTGTKQVIVFAEDKCGNASTTESANLNGSGGSGGIGGDGSGMDSDMFKPSYYYRTSMFNYWLMGTGSTN